LYRQRYVARAPQEPTCCACSNEQTAYHQMRRNRIVHVCAEVFADGRARRAPRCKRVRSRPDMAACAAVSAGVVVLRNAAVLPMPPMLPVRPPATARRCVNFVTTVCLDASCHQQSGARFGWVVYAKARMRGRRRSISVLLRCGNSAAPAYVMAVGMVFGGAKFVVQLCYRTSACICQREKRCFAAAESSENVGTSHVRGMRVLWGVVRWRLPSERRVSLPQR